MVWDIAPKSSPAPDADSATPHKFPAWLPTANTPVLWPREFHGLWQPGVGKSSDKTERLSSVNLLKKVNHRKIPIHVM